MTKTLRLFFVPIALVLSLGTVARAADINSKDFTGADLFQLSKIWTVELVFTPAEWKAMTPRFDGPQGAGFLVGPAGGHNGFLAARGLTFDWAHADLTIGGRHFPDIGVRYKGNGTYMEGSGRNKISMKLNLTKYVKGQKLANMTTVNLANNITDAGWMNEELAYKLFRDAGCRLRAPLTQRSMSRLPARLPGDTRDYIR